MELRRVAAEEWSTVATLRSTWAEWSATRLRADLYLRIAGVFYAPFGFGLAFFFASQGAGRLTWPLAGSVARLVLAVAGGAIAIRMQSLPLLYAVIGCSFLVYALVPAIAFRRGAWDRSGDTVR